MQTLFWTFFLIILYAYLVYPAILYVISSIQKILRKNSASSVVSIEPDVTLFVAAYNEIDFVKEKVENSFSLNYPSNKIQHVWVTDGSDDGTPDYLKSHKKVQVYHVPERNGKTGAINRGMEYVKTPIVIFTDANSILNKNAIKYIVEAFEDPKVGCVAGEKRIKQKNTGNAASAGEGLYWKYESFIKKCESEIYSAVGAVGELFAIRPELFDKIENDTILDDFVISLRIALKGYKIKYEPRAIATEGASLNIKEELKRKTRIAYGGFQSVWRLKKLLNPLINPLLTFQYVSHKLLRWLIVPFSFIFIFLTNIFLAYSENWEGIYTLILYAQLFFYFMVFLGALFQQNNIKLKFLFAPYYLFIMNLAEILGLIRYIRKNQSVNWDRSKRV